MANYKYTGKNALIIYNGPGMKLFISWLFRDDGNIQSWLRKWHKIKISQVIMEKILLDFIQKVLLLLLHGYTWWNITQTSYNRNKISCIMSQRG